MDGLLHYKEIIFSPGSVPHINHISKAEMVHWLTLPSKVALS